MLPSGAKSIVHKVIYLIVSIHFMQKCTYIKSSHLNTQSKFKIVRAARCLRKKPFNIHFWIHQVNSKDIKRNR